MLTDPGAVPRCVLPSIIKTGPSIGQTIWFLVSDWSSKPARRPLIGHKVVRELEVNCKMKAKDNFVITFPHNIWATMIISGATQPKKTFSAWGLRRVKWYSSVQSAAASSQTEPTTAQCVRGKKEMHPGHAVMLSSCHAVMQSCCQAACSIKPVRAHHCSVCQR